MTTRLFAYSQTVMQSFGCRRFSGWRMARAWACFGLEFAKKPPQSREFSVNWSHCHIANFPIITLRLNLVSYKFSE